MYARVCMYVYMFVCVYGFVRVCCVCAVCSCCCCSPPAMTLFVLLHLILRPLVLFAPSTHAAQTTLQRTHTHTHIHTYTHRSTPQSPVRRSPHAVASSLSLSPSLSISLPFSFFHKCIYVLYRVDRMYSPSVVEHAVCVCRSFFPVACTCACHTFRACWWHRPWKCSAVLCGRA